MSEETPLRENKVAEALSDESAPPGDSRGQETKSDPLGSPHEMNPSLIIDLESEIENDSDFSRVENSSDNDSSASDDSDDESSEVDESLSSNIIREIQDGLYTCLVCTCEIDQDSTIWSCRLCYRVYDLDCIRDWAIRGSSTDKTSKQWRCPSCNVATNKIPSRFTCWCGRTTNPLSSSLIPFSCGNSCTYKYSTCIHSCSSVCHPGSHPICGAMGPLMKCRCGRHEQQLPCLITPYKTGWRCEDPCPVILCDMGHTCSRGCHAGFCGPCPETITAKCYCGKEDLSIKCSDKNLMICNNKGVVTDATEVREWVGVGACKNITKVYYECGEHFEEFSCQPIPEKQECKLAPGKVTTCYCGATNTTTERLRCTDPIPECDEQCDKILPCGCNCLLKCHEGECECHNYFDVPCSCGYETFTVPCKFIQQGYKPKCTRKCTVMLNCKRHYHREVCCAYEKAAYARERAKKKALRNNTRSNFSDELMSIEAVHICTKTCNRLKQCGLHYCEAMCHAGPCGVCLESSSEDLVCSCGKTVIQAPVRCGTKIECHEQCTRPKDCGHPPEIHECHDDSTNCPKCTMLMEKKCNCGLKSDIPGVMCSQTNVSCGHICTVPKSCGHPCLRVCNPKCTNDNIHDSSTLCRSDCNKPRTNCPHKCKLKCHFNKVGKSKNCDANPCSELVTVVCGCGNIQQKIACGASSINPSMIDLTLECNEQCAQLKRDKELRESFNLYSIGDSPTPQDQIYPNLVLDVFAKQRTWCSNIETIMRNFVEDFRVQEANDVSGRKKTHHFAPMSRPQRTFVHELGECYGLYTESQDPEPKRSVFIVITRNTALPLATITDVLNRKKELAAQEAKVNECNEYNALVIQDVFFGVTKQDLEQALKPVSEEFMLEDATLKWIKDSTFIYYSQANYKETGDRKLQSIGKRIRLVLRDKSLAFDCKTCFVDNEAEYILKVFKESETPPAEPETKETVSTNAFDVLQEE